MAHREDLDGLVVLLRFRGKIHQVILNSDQERQLLGHLEASFAIRGEKIKVMNEPLEGLSFMEGSEYERRKNNGG